MTGVRDPLPGAVIMGVVRNGLNLMAVDYNVQKAVIGGMTIAAVSVDVFARRFGSAMTR